MNKNNFDFQGFEEQAKNNEENQLCLNKISNFLEMKNISIGQFWQSNRNYASPQDIQKFCQSCGLRLGIYEQINIKAEIFKKSQIISIYEFCELIPFWKQNSQERVANFLKERSEVLVQSLNHKHKTQKRTINSANPTRSLSRPQTSKVTRMYSTQKTKNFIQNNSHQYLRKYKEKNEISEQKLAETIEKTKNQYQYNMLIKMNELNEFNKANKSTITYRAWKNAEGNIIVKVFNLDKVEKELTLKEFESEYKICKKSTKENTPWERQTYGVYTSKKKDKSNSQSISKNAKKQERQEELRNLLVNTVTLTNILKEQIKIFKLRGIYGCQNVL